ncbi:hypothetical protein P3L10_021674 [Capsicum annuum]
MEVIEKEKDMPIIWESGLIEELDELKTADVTCGLDHSLALCCKSHLLMSSGGSNVYGQLGSAKKNLKMQPIDTFEFRAFCSSLQRSLIRTNRRCNKCCIMGMESNFSTWEGRSRQHS